MNIAESIERATVRLGNAGLCFGHGTDNAGDEAAWLVLQVAGAAVDGSFNDWGRAVTAIQQAEMERLLEARCRTRQPLAYLLGKAWFAGLEFEVNEHVLVPRSPLAELILDRYQPWVEPDRVRRVLDLCTGSGCIAIATALQLTSARIDAVDISTDALAVARRNVDRHQVAERVTLIESDLFQSVPGTRYELIVANPPYVPAGSVAELPQEYQREPGLGLVSGADGLDAAVAILLDAPRFLSEYGVLICEVGESEERLATALPRVPFLWLEFEHGGSGVFVLTREQLEESGAELARLVKERKNVL